MMPIFAWEALLYENKIIPVTKYKRSLKYHMHTEDNILSLEFLFLSSLVSDATIVIIVNDLCL